MRLNVIRILVVALSVQEVCGGRNSASVWRSEAAPLPRVPPNGTEKILPILAARTALPGVKADAVADDPFSARRTDNIHQSQPFLYSHPPLSSSLVSCFLDMSLPYLLPLVLL